MIISIKIKRLYQIRLLEEHFTKKLDSELSPEACILNVNYNLNREIEIMKAKATKQKKYKYIQDLL